MFTIITVLCLLGALSFPTLMLTFAYPVSRRLALFWSNYITTRTARLVFAILRCYQKFDFLGDEKSKDSLPEQFIVISNHQSLLDIVVYFKYLAPRCVRFIAKDALGSAPMVGKMLRSQEHCMIPRKGSPSVAMKSIEKFGRRAMERGQIPVIFPEGTRSRTGELGPFYAAGFRRLVQTARLPVAVCALDGGWRLSNIKDVLHRLSRGAYRVKVLKVYDAPSTKEEEKLILEEGKELIQRQLDEWRA